MCDGPSLNDVCCPATDKIDKPLDDKVYMYSPSVLTDTPPNAKEMPQGPARNRTTPGEFAEST